MANITAPAPVRTVRTRYGAIVTFDDGYPFEFVGGHPRSLEDYADEATERRDAARANVIAAGYTLSEDGPRGARTVPGSVRYDNRDAAEVAAFLRTKATGIETWSTLGDVEGYYEPADY